jgi:hypothetical protein
LLADSDVDDEVDVGVVVLVAAARNLGTGRPRKWAVRRRAQDSLVEWRLRDCKDSIGVLPTSTKESASRMNSALALRSSGDAIATNLIAFSSPSSMYAHCLIERIDFVAAMPLFAIKTLRMTRLPPRSLIY